MDDQRLRVLLVEDDEDDYILTRNLLSEVAGNRYYLDWVKTHEAALQAMECGQYDVCLLDYLLGQHDGLEILKEMAGEGCDVPVILLTGQGGYEIDIAAMEAGAADYLVKDQINAPMLERSIRYAIRQKQAEAKLQRNNLALAEAIKAKDQMIANVSHELRTPLTHIIGYAELLTYGLVEGELSKEQRRSVEIIMHEATHLADLVDTLISLQTLTSASVTWQAVDLSLVLDRAAQDWQSEAQKKQITLTLNTFPSAPSVQGDPRLLRKAFDQVIDNALKFTDGGGMVAVEIESRGNEVWLTFTDTGIGIQPDQLESVFDAFHQVDGSSTRSYGGMGIGLSLVREIVSLHGGRVWAESEGEGQGTTLLISLPLTPDPNLPLGAPSRGTLPQPEPVGKGWTDQADWSMEP